jgi:hypothetical protein
MRISVRGESWDLVSPEAFPYAWIEGEFLKRNLYPPKREEILRWVSRNPQPEDLVEELYRNLHVRAVFRALSDVRINRKNVSPELLSLIVERSGRGIIDLSKEEIGRRVREALASLVSERLRGENDPLSLYRLLTSPPFCLFVLAWSDLSVDPPRPAEIRGRIAQGLERLIESQGGTFPRATALSLFRKAREAIKEEKRRLSAAEKARKDQEKAYRSWIRSLWSSQDVKRALSLRRCEFEDWVREGRIPVAFRTEFRKWGQTLEKKLFDPEVIGAFTLKMVQAWRDEREREKRERRRKKPGRSKKPDRTDRRKGPESL